MVIRRSTLTALTVPLLLLALAACGKAGRGPGVATVGGPAASASAKASLDPQEAKRKFAECMRDHGVDVPDPGPNGGVRIADNVPKQKLVAAMDACQSLLPDGGDFARLGPEQVEQGRRFARCMRDHGIDVPDPDANTGIARIINDPNIDFNSKPFKDAMEACRALAPTMPASGSK